MTQTTHSTDATSPTIEGYLTMCGVKNFITDNTVRITDPVSEFTLKFKTFKLGQVVTKTKGSNWTGKVVGFYSTNLTPEGYAVESMTETGSVQIYPVSALCDYAEAVRVRLANSDKVTREDIKHLYEHLSKSDTYFQRIMSTQDDVAYCADITKFEGKLTCRIFAFSKTKATLQQIVNNEHVKVMVDWVENNRVWFKYEHNGFHSLMEYTSDYAENFVIDQTKPKLYVALIFPI